MLTLLLAALLHQQPQQPATRNPVARVVVTPADPAIVIGDTIRLRATAYDSAGHPLPGARIRWFGDGEGGVDSTGLVTGSARGMVTVRVVAALPGAPSRPVTVRVRVHSPPASRVEIAPAVSRLLVGQRLRLEALPYASNGDRRYDEIRWTSSAPRVVSVGDDGRLTARAVGRATLTAAAGAASATLAVTVTPNTIRRLEITGGAPGARTGDVLRFGVVARDAAGREISGVTPTWSLTPGQGLIDHDGTFVAYAPGTYVVTADFGSVSTETSVRVAYRNVRRPTRTIGRLPVARMPTAEFWPHPDGRHAYLTTIGDRMYAVDISDPAHLAFTDSIIVDARTINDVMTTPDGRFGVITREGASNRRNGIVILSLEDPAHPRVIGEYTETVTGGVHSSYVYSQPRYGTHIYITDDATGSMRVIDINDAAHPREVARFQVDAPEAGRYLHDVDLWDGLAYLSYWDNGLVIVDVGNGMRGGSPTTPQLVSQLKYDLNDVYRRVEEEGGPGFTRGTHTAWRHRSRPLVFVGDEVYSAPGAGMKRMFGRLHVIDVTEINHPREIAWYEPPDGGSHNVWVAGDTLYLGDYQGGLRVVDISGDLRGDLLAAGREMAWLATGDSRGTTPNAPMAWGAFWHNGLIWANDLNSGLWAVRLEPRREMEAAPAVP
ncbi:MAG: Ig-like domain-containing protein [Gemmatimonadetes bacterium]|nr:Ig-like domain-containing protein [Gemmatimonadota bacterium]